MKANRKKNSHCCRSRVTKTISCTGSFQIRVQMSSRSAKKSTKSPPRTGATPAATEFAKVLAAR